MTPRQPLAASRRSDVAGIVWPPIAVGSAAALVALVGRLDASQWDDPDDIVAGQHRQLAVVAEHAARNSPHFSRRLRRAGLAARDLTAAAALRQLPVLRRRDIQASGADLVCRDVPAGHRPVEEVRTSGSTGEPVVVKRTAVDQLFWAAMTVRDHLWHDRDVTKRFSSIRGTIFAYRQAASWGAPMDLLFTTGPSQHIPIESDVAQQARWLCEFEPETLLIYPTSLGVLAEHFAQRGLSLPGLRHIRTIGETLSPAIRSQAVDVFGVKVDDLYSSQELGVIAVQCPTSDLYHVMAESVIVEVVDAAGQPCRPGDVGSLVITALHNFATPIVRYAIGDYAEVATPCPCGRGLPTLRRILGRERNLILMPDGTRHWPLFDAIRFRDIAGIRQYQFIQHARERIEVRLVAERAVAPDRERELRDAIQHKLGYPFSLDFTYFDDQLPRTPAGKFEQFVCHVTAERAQEST